MERPFKTEKKGKSGLQQTAGGKTCGMQNGDIINYRFDVLCAIQNTNDISGIK